MTGSRRGAPHLPPHATLLSHPRAADQLESRGLRHPAKAPPRSCGSRPMTANCCTAGIAARRIPIASGALLPRQHRQPHHHRVTSSRTFSTPASTSSLRLSRLRAQQRHAVVQRHRGRTASPPRAFTRRSGRRTCRRSSTASRSAARSPRRSSAIIRFDGLILQSTFTNLPGHRARHLPARAAAPRQPADFFDTLRACSSSCTCRCWSSTARSDEVVPVLDGARSSTTRARRQKRADHRRRRPAQGSVRRAIRTRWSGRSTASPPRCRSARTIGRRSRAAVEQPIDAAFRYVRRMLRRHPVQQPL